MGGRSGRSVGIFHICLAGKFSPGRVRFRADPVCGDPDPQGGCMREAQADRYANSTCETSDTPAKYVNHRDRDPAIRYARGAQ